MRSPRNYLIHCAVALLSLALISQSVSLPSSAETVSAVASGEAEVPQVSSQGETPAQALSEPVCADKNETAAHFEQARAAGHSEPAQTATRSESAQAAMHFEPSQLDKIETENTQTTKSTTLLALRRIDENTEQSLESLTTRIAKKETELLRSNTEFRIEATRISKWKPWRLFLYNLGASMTSNAGITEISASRWRYWTSPAKMSRTTGAAGPTLLLIGHCISLGGVMTETALDKINDHKIAKKGLDIKRTHKKVLSLKSEIDDLIAQRDSLLANSPALNSQEVELAKAEGVVLKDVRDLGLNEYSQFYVRANRFFANRDTNSLMAATAASTGGFQGSLLGIISARRKQPEWVGPGGIGFIISGAAIAATPEMTRAAAILKGKVAKKRIGSELGHLNTKSTAQLEADRAKLSQMVAQTDPSVRSNLTNLTKRLDAYEKQNVLFTAQNEMNKKEKELADKEFLERVFFASCIGGSKMSWGINLANAGFRFHPKTNVAVVKVTKTVIDPVTKTPRTTTSLGLRSVPDPGPSKVFLQRVATGATTYVPGTGLWMIDTLQNRLRGEMRDRALARQKRMPAAILRERMDRVQEIDDVFNY